jgi:hypothetical protein
MDENFISRNGEVSLVTEHRNLGTKLITWTFLDGFVKIDLLILQPVSESERKRELRDLR